jgi:MoaA/NifB/PqqE/SkfB family radical SAM enzyme
MAARSWTQTSAGDPRGYIQAEKLEELWFHTGTKCNLSCPFCLEGSSPTSNRLPYLTLEETQPFIEEAVELGIEAFSFTGGEPFLNPSFMSILKLALKHRSCLVLTNGTKPLQLKLPALQALKAQSSHELKFRVSLDSPEIPAHDEGRGEGSFVMAMEGIRQLLNLGFQVSVAAHWPKGKTTTELSDRYQEVFREHDIAEELKMVFFPDFHKPHQSVEVPEITETCMTTYQTEASRAEFMCSFSRMVIKRGDTVKVSACTLVDDDETLTGSLKPRVMLAHHRCFSCFSCGSSCSEK